MRYLIALAAGITAVAPIPAGDWPQWLGPNRDGTTDEIVKPWTEPPKLLWRVPVGEGHSSPIVVKGRVYLQEKVKDQDAEQLRSWGNGEDGQTLGPFPRKAFESQFGNGPRSTPSILGDRMITVGVTGLLHSTPAPPAQPVGWAADLLGQFNAKNLMFGVSASPLVEDDLVLVMPGGKGAAIAALNRHTGATVWQQFDDPASYSSPIAFSHGGKRQAVFLTANRVISVDPKTGEMYWEFPFKDALSESSATPVKVGDYLIASSVTLGSVCLRLTAKDGKPGVEQIWKNPQLPCYFSTPASVGEQFLYMVTGSITAVFAGKPEATLNCVELATGKVLWSKPKVGKYHAALTRLGDGKLLMLQDNGELVLIDPDPKEYKELCRAKVCGECWAHPALSDGRLHVRDDKELICIQLRN